MLELVDTKEIHLTTFCMKKVRRNKNVLKKKICKNNKFLRECVENVNFCFKRGEIEKNENIMA